MRSTDWQQRQLGHRVASVVCALHNGVVAMSSGETVKSRVSHQPPGFRMGKEYPGITLTNAERANGC